MFAVTTIWGRLVIVPITIITALLAYGLNNTVTNVLLVFFVCFDPSLAIITLVVLQKYGHEGLEKGSRNINLTNEYQAPQVTQITQA